MFPTHRLGMTHIPDWRLTNWKVGPGYRIGSTPYRVRPYPYGSPPAPNVRVGTILESNDATYFEDIFPMKDMSSSSHQEMPTSSSQELVPTSEPAISMEHVENPME